MKTAVICTTFNRPAALARSLPQIVAAAREVGAPVLVVDDGSTDVGWTRANAIRKSRPWHAEEVFQDDIEDACEGIVTLLRLPENRGLAAALNIGLAYWLADPSIEAIHYFQDDVEVDPLCIAACNAVLTDFPKNLVTGHDAKEHRERFDDKVFGFKCPMPSSEISIRMRNSCRATHMMATRESWLRVLPIPSRGLSLPGTRIMDGKRGTGSGVDWWIVRDSPNHLPVLCIPGLVRSFAHKAQDSTWLNESIGGEEPPLSRDAIQEWLKSRS
jgi:hypothetical protein